MSTDLPAYLFSFVWPTAALLLLSCFVFRARIPPRPARSFSIATLCAAAIVCLPLGGIPLGRWFTGLCANFSLPLLALIADLLGRRVFGTDLLEKKGRRAAAWFGAIAGVVLYPMALGIGKLDPYVSGWFFSWLFAVAGVLTALLLLRGNRFGLALLAAIAAFHLHLLESDNYWDYLVDPVYFTVSAVLVARDSLRRIGAAADGA